MPRSAKHLVWIDLEMTGLDHEACHIIEIATIVTDSALEILAEGPNFVIHADEDALATLSDWSREHFTASGLLDRVRASKVTMAEAEAQTLAFVKRWTKPETAPLCGNSIHTDRAFLYRQMRTPARPPALPQRGRLHAQGTARALVPGQREPPTQGGQARGPRRHSRVHCRAARIAYYRDAFVAPRKPA